VCRTACNATGAEETNKPFALTRQAQEVSMIAHANVRAPCTDEAVSYSHLRSAVMKSRPEASPR